MKSRYLRQSIYTLLFSCFIFSLQAQEVWSLEKCIRHALDNSLNIEQAKIGLQRAEIASVQARHSRFPTLNANTQFGFNFGRAINPSTNNFESENSNFSSMGLGTNMTIFAGNRITNSIKQTSIDIETANLDIQQTENDIALNVALAYLNVLFAEENLTNSGSQLALTTEQLSQVEKLIAAGVRPQSERYDILAQIALDEQSIVQNRNSWEINLLSLKNLLLLDPSFDIAVDKPEIDLENQERLEQLNFDVVYSAALASQPNIRAGELRQESTEIGVDIARGALSPTLSVSGNAGTNYFNLAKLPTGFVTQRFQVDGVYINGELTDFAQDRDVLVGDEKVPFFDQYDNNLGYGLTATLQVPIYNNYQTRAGLERAQIDILQQKTSNEQLKQTLKANVQNAIAEARAARESLEASEKSLEASEIALQNAQRRYDLGAINTFDFINAKNRQDQAQVLLTISKYDYLFKVKVLEYYLGRGLKLR